MQLLTLLKINCKLGSKVLLPLEYLVLQVSKGLELLNEYFIEKKYSSGIPYPEIAKYVYLHFFNIVWFLQSLSHFLFVLEAKNKFTRFCTRL